jgi:NADH:ubiquinone oxidoreductase subunit 4 (subunit M)
LPIAHVEAPLPGSILLSGILLKMGAYGLWLVARYPSSLSAQIISLSLVGSVICSIVCLRSSDLKVLIAYSSIVHMGIVLLGIYSGTELGSWSALTMIFAHTFTSPLLFMLAFEQYVVMGSRSVIHYAKLSLGPYFALLFCLASASNFGLPPFLSFFSELTLFLVLSDQSFFWSLVQAIIAFLTFCYSVFLSTSIFGLGPTSPIYSGSFNKLYLLVLVPVLILSFPGSLFVI